MVRGSWADTMASISRMATLGGEGLSAGDRRRKGKFQRKLSLPAWRGSPGQAMAEKSSGVGETQATTQLLFVLFWAASQSKQSRVGKRRGCVVEGSGPT